MSSTNTSEAGLEALIVADMTGNGAAKTKGHEAKDLAAAVADPAGTYGQCWLPGDASDYDRAHAVDLRQLRLFLEATQPKLAEELDLANDSHRRRSFLARLQGVIAKEGVVHALRKGIDDGPLHIDLYYPTPTPGNATASLHYAANRFTVTRQLHFSPDQTKLSLDLCCFLNGLPIFTFELKNSLTKQTVEDAVEQYRRDRDPKELLFQFGRCVAHFAVDDALVKFCTDLKGKASWFLPFDQGWNDGAGNPPNPNGLKTDYLWKRVLAPMSLSNILESYAQVVEFKDDKTGRKKQTQIYPRYHQLSVVRALLKHARDNGAGQKYLVQHSAGSGKSNSIAWLAHQLTGLEHEDKVLFDSIIVVTDRRNLDKQISETIKQFTQVRAVVGHADRSGNLREMIEGGKKIIISTIQKFPHILDEIGSAHAGRRFAIIIDEAHSSQGGKASAALNTALSGEEEEEETMEDKINALIEAKKLLPNASYFAFTATPKHKTLELFGVPYEHDGRTKFKPFHSYTMKQAIQEGFIMDVLKYYTPVDSFYKLVKRVEEDPEFDTSRANKKLRRYVEGHDHAIRMKAEIMVDHFHEQVLAQNKVGGKARAMLVTNGIDRAMQYFAAFNAYLAERKSPYKAIIAFSGEQELDGHKVTEASMNGFPSNKIEEEIEQDPYRFLICADKFQTGYDQPLMHTMYVDKTLNGIKAVQTLSRLNRAHPQKHDVFVLDFMNDVDTIQQSFADFYRTTILSEGTDPNILHDLNGALDGHGLYDTSLIDDFVAKYLGGASRDTLDPALDITVAHYVADLDEDQQVAFKGSAKAFCRTYGFLSGILPYKKPEWEKLSIFLNFLIPKLPAPVEEDLARGILEAIDMDSYRVEKKAMQAIDLPDADSEIAPIPGTAGGRKPEPELDHLSNIIKVFNEHWGNIPWEDKDRITERLTKEIPAKVAADSAYQNAIKNSDKQNARIEMDKALLRVMIGLMKDETQLFKEFSDNPGFKRWLGDSVFGQTYLER
ncbi:MAG TPA: DEAD/DEAH box helicase family protein [Flavobacteriales bacterium]|nr:MAG: type I restriction endonuclease subunit R [Flavobacteriales bacterium]HQV38939.1 DEAD/DEAH box helicase family protein [Flavobacteriales bacterium]HQW32415.1 DEAD/DEAH box helicase family protein [Flavobacteriales bacterium]HQY79913.1 DEAD/DEAH box helicase family protein [Flavobacteriales bacterium]HRA17659.1 DEAD/DEAH box helicase family protein [Flavobacteriales bacterium]